jgi:hypothetical protein
MDVTLALNRLDDVVVAVYVAPLIMIGLYLLFN